MNVKRALCVLVAGLFLASGLGMWVYAFRAAEVEANPGSEMGSSMIFNEPPMGYTAHTVPRVVLMEDNTNWGCGPCASHNPPWKATAEAFGYSQVAPVYMHVHWPSSTDPWNNYGNMNTWANWRRSQEGCTYVPWPMIDGKYVPYGQTQAYYTTEVNNRLSIPSKISITSSGKLDYPSANQATLKVNIEATDDLPRADWRVIVQIWENNVTRLGTGPNGETVYDWATWLFLDQDADDTNNHNGVSIWSTGAEAGSSVSMTYTFNLESSWPRAELGATIFVQDFKKIGGGESSPVSVEQARVELLRNLEPTVSITAPAPNTPDQILSGTVPITWSASDIESAAGTLDISIDYSTSDGYGNWTNIMAGTDNNISPFTYNWVTTTVPDGIGYILRVRAKDGGGATGYATSYYPFSIDNVADDEWFFQAQATGTYKDLSMKPAQKNANLASTSGITVAGHSKVGTWETVKTFTNSNIDGDWTFKVYGKVPNRGLTVLQGYLYAKIFTSSNMGSPLHTTALDNENAGSFQASHLFTWNSAASGNIGNGDRIVIEIWFEATGGPYSQNSGMTLNPTFDSGSTSWTYYDWIQTQPTGTHRTTGGNPNGYVEISFPNPGGNPNTAHTMAGYWQQSFTTGFAPYQVNISFDYIYTAATSASWFYVFVDTTSGNPTIGNEVWSQRMSTVSSWIHVDPIDISYKVTASTTYYLKIALYHGAAYPSSYPCTGGYDNVQLSWATPYPWFEMEYDYARTQSSVEPTIGSSGTSSAWAQISVSSGWNLVSVPISGPTAMPGALTDLNGTIVQWTRAMWYNPRTPADPWKQYNAGWGSSLNDLTAVNNTMGVWLYVTTVADGVITVGGTSYSQPSSTSVQLRTGWNLVGFPSDDTTYTVASLKSACPTVTLVEQYDGAQTYKTSAMLDATAFVRGRAYWVYTTADTTWNKGW
jgi:hypothetical protein